MLQGLAPDRVFTIGTASKALAPAVRLGWVLAPPSLAAAVAAEKLISDRGWLRAPATGAGAGLALAGALAGVALPGTRSQAQAIPADDMPGLQQTPAGR